MNLKNTKIEGLKLFKLETFKDNRGCFYETFNKKKYNTILNNVDFVQENHSSSIKGVLRGLHFQKPPFSQSKLVQCIKGEVMDVALDLRNSSDTYGQFEITILSELNKKQIFIPKGFAHGFLVLSDSAILTYKVDNYYNPSSESGILWNDPDLNINWNFLHSEIIVSEKDQKLFNFKNFISPFQ